jgi:hypothetical protein
MNEGRAVKAKASDKNEWKVCILEVRTSVSVTVFNSANSMFKYPPSKKLTLWDQGPVYSTST